MGAPKTAASIFREASNTVEVNPEEVINKFLEHIRNELIAGRDVSIRGFGRFYPYYNKDGKRTAYDFKTGQTRTISCRPKVKFESKFDGELNIGEC